MKLWDKCSYLQASNASPPLGPKLHSESDPLSACFPKPLVTPAEDTQSEPESSASSSPLPAPRCSTATTGGLGEEG